jgi:hypothetical protein
MPAAFDENSEQKTDTYKIDLLKQISDNATLANLNTLDFDSDVVKDKQRYSEWLGAFATAGLFILATGYKDFHNESLSLFIHYFLFLLPAVLLGLSLLMGAFIYKASNNYIYLQRRNKTLVVKQNAIIIDFLDPVPLKIDMYQSIWDMKYLDDSDRRVYIEEKSRKRKLQDKIESGITWQQATLALGIIGIFTNILLREVPEKLPGAEYSTSLQSKPATLLPSPALPAHRQ